MKQSKSHDYCNFYPHPHPHRIGTPDKSGHFDMSLHAPAAIDIPRGMRRPLILQALQPSCANPLNQAFIGHVFEDESTLDAYFFPKQVSRYSRGTSAVGSGSACDGPGGTGPAGECLLPLEAARRAGLHAQSMSLIQPEERHLVNVAAFLYPCSLFHLSRIEALSLTKPPIPTFEAIDTMRALLLEESLHRLRCRHAGLGNTLAAVLGLPHDDDVNTDQVTRMAAAVCLANLKVTAIWTEMGGRA